MPEAVIVATARTPIGKAFKGALNATHGAEMGAHVIRAAMERAKLAPDEIEDVLLGTAVPMGATGGNIARQSALRAGLPAKVAGISLDRKCASGLQTIAFAAQRIIAGEEGIYIAGGLDSCSLTRQFQMKPLPYAEDPWLLAHKPELYWPMIKTADVVAARYGISREAQDAYALESQRRTAAAQLAGRVSAEIAPITAVKQLFDKAGNVTGEEKVTLSMDEGQSPRDDARRAGGTQAGERRRLHHRR